jgi:hypothetical protein
MRGLFESDFGPQAPGNAVPSTYASDMTRDSGIFLRFSMTSADVDNFRGHRIAKFLPEVSFMNLGAGP